MYRVVKLDKPIRYQEGLLMQQRAYEQVKNKEVAGVLFILEHSPVYTIGVNGGWENLKFPKEFFVRNGIDIVETNRGGNITYHGPGQLVAYPVFDLTCLRKDAHWFIDSLEDVIINVLKAYDLRATRKRGYRGVWIDDNKVAAIGVSLRNWITTHGLSFNINPDIEYFSMINPCGITDFGVSSLSDYVANAEISIISEQLINSFAAVFDIELTEMVEIF